MAAAVDGVMPGAPSRQQPPAGASSGDEGAPPEGPPPEGSSEPQQSACIHLHEIRPADTLLSIAAQYDVPVQELVQLNRLTSSDIWFHRHLTIPCRRPACLSSCASSSSASAAGAPPEGNNRERQASQQSSQQPSGSRGSSGVGAQAGVSPMGATASGGPPVPQEPSRATRGSGGPSEGPHKGPLSEEVQESANLAMLVEALVRETDIHPRIARQRITARSLNYEAALRDCLELRRWAAEMDLSAPELLAYLIIHSGDLQRAHTALVEDLQWHKDNTLRSQMVHGGLQSSFSWLNHLRPGFLGGPSRGRYRRLPSEGSPNVFRGPPVHLELGAPPTSSGAPPLPAARRAPSTETARGGPPSYPQAEGNATLLHFNSTSLEALRRRPVGRGQREVGGPPQGPHDDGASPFTRAPVARGAPPTPAVGAPVPEPEEDEQEGKRT
ncbi:hypothetical protein Emed_005848 [Eimeria media]